MTITFLLTSLVMILLPGTGVIYTLSVGLTRGFVPSIAAAFGCTLSIIPAALAGILGLATIFHSSAVIFNVVKYLGVIYLLYMAYSTLKSGGVLAVDESTANTKGLFKIMYQGTLLNVLSPKLSLFFVAFLPQFIDVNSGDTTLQMMFLAFVFMFLTFLVFVCYGALATLARQYVLSSPSVMQWLKRLFAGVFGFLGLKLAL